MFHPKAILLALLRLLPFLLLLSLFLLQLHPSPSLLRPHPSRCLQWPHPALYWRQYRLPHHPLPNHPLPWYPLPQFHPQCQRLLHMCSRGPFLGMGLPPGMLPFHCWLHPGCDLCLSFCSFLTLYCHIFLSFALSIRTAAITKYTPVIPLGFKRSYSLYVIRPIDGLRSISYLTTNVLSSVYICISSSVHSGNLCQGEHAGHFLFLVVLVLSFCPC